MGEARTVDDLRWRATLGSQVPAVHRAVERLIRDRHREATPLGFLETNMTTVVQMTPRPSRRERRRR